MENSDKDFKRVIDEWQEKTFKLRRTAYMISGILVFVFLIAVVIVVVMQFASKNDSWQTSAEICNTFTGIVLGFVAMAVSVISIVLSFYNTIQAEKSNIDSIKQFNEIITNNKNLSDSLNNVSDSLSSELDKLTELITKQVEFEELLTTISSEVKEINKSHHPSVTTVVEPVPQTIDDLNDEY